MRKTYEEDKREILAFGREAAAVKERLSAEAAQLRAQLASGGGVTFDTDVGYAGGSAIAAKRGCSVLCISSSITSIAACNVN